MNVQRFQILWLKVLVASCGLALAVSGPRPLAAQDEPAGSGEKPSPTTTADPEIDVADLQLLVKPLTKEELVVEADGWRDLLKECIQRIAKVRIDLRQQKEAAATEGAAADPPESEAAPATDAGAAESQKQELAESLPELNEEKAHLVDRMTVVVNELEAKGGEVEAYRQYISAQSGVAVEVTDASTFWTVLSGWLTSEQGGQRWGWNIAKFLVIVLAFYFTAAIIANAVRHAVSRIKGVSQLLVDFLGKFVKQIVMVIGVIVGLAALEVNIAPLLAAVGAAGFVIAFALQDTLSNFASGMLILAYRPFDVGDVIEAAGVSGVVGSVTLFSTHVRTFDNKMMIVPNNDIWGGTITNATASDTRRVDMVFGIGYGDDIDQAKGILERLIKDHELVLDDPAPVIQLNELGDSSVNFIARPWTKTGDYWTVYWDITRSVKDEFDRNGISIPYPQRDVHVYQEPSANA